MTTSTHLAHGRSSGTHSDSSGCDGRVAPDALSEVLQDLRLAGASYRRTDVVAPWGLEIPSDDGAVFHFMLHPLLWMMPEVLHVPSGGRDDPALAVLLDTIATEVREQRMSTATVADPSA
jgi:hypothetical protein